MLVYFNFIVEQRICIPWIMNSIYHEYIYLYFFLKMCGLLSLIEFIKSILNYESSQFDLIVQLISSYIKLHMTSYITFVYKILYVYIYLYDSKMIRWYNLNDEWYDMMIWC